MDHYLCLKVFCLVAARGSFSRAARELGLAQSAVSRGIFGLEERLGRPLFERTTRRVTLTREGRAYLERVEEHVLALEDAELHAASGFADLAGNIRMSAPGALGRRLLLPELVRTMRDTRGIVVDAAFTDRRLDLVGEGIDFSFRVGKGSETSFVEREVAESPQWFVGSKEMFGDGEPKTLEELANYPCLVSGRTREFSRMGAKFRLTTDDLEASFEAVRGGLGFAVLPRWLVAESVRSGTLVRLLPAEPLPSPPIVVVYPRRIRRVARQVMEHLERHIRREVLAPGEFAP